jgi:para-nitrobenzyl esterase
LAALGLSKTDFAELDRLPLETLLRAQAEVERDTSRWPQFRPMQDEALWPLDGEALASYEAGSQTPLIIGFNRDEWNFFAAASIRDWSEPLEESSALEHLACKLPDRSASSAARLLSVYRESRRARSLPHDNRAVVRAIEGDLRFGIRTLRFAERHAASGSPTFVYRFSYSSPALRGALGACHALELSLVFGTYGTPEQERFVGKGPDVERLSRIMQTAWLGFAEHGDPNHSELPVWSAYDERRPTLVFDVPCELALGPFEEERRAWDGIV